MIETGGAGSYNTMSSASKRTRLSSDQAEGSPVAGELESVSAGKTTSRRQLRNSTPAMGGSVLAGSGRNKPNTSSSSSNSNNNNNNKFGVGDADDLSDDSASEDEEQEADDEEEEEEEEEAEDDEGDDDAEADDDDDVAAGGRLSTVVSKLDGELVEFIPDSQLVEHRHHSLSHSQNGLAGQPDIQEQLAAAGPAGVAAAAAIASARKRKRSHCFETNPSVRKRQQTRLIRKLRACIDEYTMRVGQQAVVLITMPGKTAHNFKVFGAQPLESVIRGCKGDIMGELEQALLEQAPQQFKNDANKHELPPLVIDGIPTPVEKMTQAQLRAFIPLMLKYSTGRGKPGWGKDSTRPPWWPETLPWANVRSDARDEGEKQRISWTTTLRQIVTNCYQFHGRDDLLPKFDESSESNSAAAAAAAVVAATNSSLPAAKTPSSGSADSSRRVPLGSRATRLRSQVALEGLLQPGSGQHQHQQQQQQQQQQQGIYATGSQNQQQQYATAANFVHTIANSDGTVSLIQIDPNNAQILTLPDGTQVRAVRLQALPAGSDPGAGLHEATPVELLEHQHHQMELAAAAAASATGSDQHTAIQVSEAQIGPDGQIIVTGEDGTQSCYPVSSLVSIPASMYHQFNPTSGGAGGQQVSIVTADGHTIPSDPTLTIHGLGEPLSGEDQLTSGAEILPVNEAEGVDQVDKESQQVAAGSGNDQQQPQTLELKREPGRLQEMPPGRAGGAELSSGSTSSSNQVMSSG